MGIPALFESGSTQEIIATFAGIITWVLITLGSIIHIIKTAKPTAGVGR